MADLHLDVDLSLEGPLLRIVYRVRNDGPTRVYLLDQLLEPRPEGLVRSRRPVVLGAGDGPVRLVLGWVPPAGKPAFFYPPAGRALDPGAEVSGAREAPWPLAAWHPFSTPPALAAEPTRAVLEIGVLEGDGGWSRLPLAGGEVVVAPELAFAAQNQKLARSAEL